MEISNKRLAAIFIAVAIIGGTFFFSAALNKGSVSPEFATVWPNSVALPEIELIADDGAPFTHEDLLGTWQLMFFGFTHCPDICPATLQQLAIVQSKLRDNGHVAPEIVLVSVDPERDTPAAISKYIAYFDATITGVTGNLEDIRKLTSTAGVFFDKSFQGGDEYTVDHSTVVLVIDKAGRIHASFGAPHIIENFISDLPKLTEEL